MNYLAHKNLIFRRFFRAVVMAVIVSFVGTVGSVQVGYPQGPFPPSTPGVAHSRSGGGGLPPPGTMVSPSPAYQPVLLKGLKIHSENPFRFDFVVDNGDARFNTGALKNESAARLIRYFLASLTIPEDDLWVNLSPHEKDRVVPDQLGTTEMGRDLLAQDYILKQLAASLTYPGPDASPDDEGRDFDFRHGRNVGKSEPGKTFWTKVRTQAREQYGITDIPMETFNKVWIVPEKAVVYEIGDTAFIVESRLKVMMEEDYVALSHNTRLQDTGHRTQESGGLEENSGIQENNATPLASRVQRGEQGASTSYTNTKDEGQGMKDVDRTSDVSRLTSDVVRDLILPEIEREVNEGQNFALLRQIYHSLILATWFKKTLKESLLGQIYVDKNKVRGVDIAGKQSKERIYLQYLEAYKKGVYNYVREEYDETAGQPVPRKYFSGGMRFAQNISRATEIVRGPGGDKAILGAMDNLTGASLDLFSIALSAAVSSAPAQKTALPEDAAMSGEGYEISLNDLLSNAVNIGATTYRMSESLPEVESRLGKGTKFTIRLPLRQETGLHADHSPGPQTTMANPVQRPPSGHGDPAMTALSEGAVHDDFSIVHEFIMEPDAKRSQLKRIEDEMIIKFASRLRGLSSRWEQTPFRLEFSEKDRHLDQLLLRINSPAGPGDKKGGSIQLHHVIANAVDAVYDETRRRGKAYRGEISLNIRFEDNQLVMALIDNGIGMSHDNLHSLITDPKHSTKEKTDDHVDGAGVGFAFYSLGFLERYEGSTQEILTKQDGRDAWRAHQRYGSNASGWEISRDQRMSIGTIVRFVIPYENQRRDLPSSSAGSNNDVAMTVEAFTGWLDGVLNKREATASRHSNALTSRDVYSRASELYDELLLLFDIVNPGDAKAPGIQSYWQFVREALTETIDAEIQTREGKDVRLGTVWNRAFQEVIKRVARQRGFVYNDLLFGRELMYRWLNDRWIGESAPASVLQMSVEDRADLLGWMVDENPELMSKFQGQAGQAFFGPDGTTDDEASGDEPQGAAGDQAMVVHADFVHPPLPGHLEGVRRTQIAMITGIEKSLGVDEESYSSVERPPIRYKVGRGEEDFFGDLDMEIKDFIRFLIDLKNELYQRGIVEYDEPLRVLEVGAGRGNLLRDIRDMAKERLLPVSFELHGTNLALENRADEIEFHHIENLEKLPFEDGEFHLVLSQKTLHFVADPLAAIEEVDRVLSPYGRALLMVGALDSTKIIDERDQKMTPKMFFKKMRAFYPEGRLELKQGLSVEITDFTSQNQFYVRIEKDGRRKSLIFPVRIEVLSNHADLGAGGVLNLRRTYRLTADIDTPPDATVGADRAMTTREVKRQIKDESERILAALGQENHTLVRKARRYGHNLAEVIAALIHSGHTLLFNYDLIFLLTAEIYPGIRGRNYLEKLEAIIRPIQDALIDEAVSPETVELISALGRLKAMGDIIRFSSVEPRAMPGQLARDSAARQGPYYILAGLADSIRYFKFMHEHPDDPRQYVFIDHSRFMEAYYNQMVVVFGLQDRVRVVRADILEYPYDPETIGTVLLSNLGPYIPTIPSTWFDRLIKAVISGGEIITTHPVLADSRENAVVLEALRHSGLTEESGYFTKAGQFVRDRLDFSDLSSSKAYVFRKADRAMTAEAFAARLDDVLAKRGVAGGETVPIRGISQLLLSEVNEDARKNLSGALVRYLRQYPDAFPEFMEDLIGDWGDARLSSIQYIFSLLVERGGGGLLKQRLIELLLSPSVERKLLRQGLVAVYFLAMTQGELFDDRLIDIVLEIDDKALREKILLLILEPLIFKRPEIFSTANLEKLKERYSDIPSFKYFLYYASLVKPGRVLYASKDFPFHSQSKKIMSGRDKKVLVVYNIKDGLGDELIRVNTFVSSLLAFNPAISVVIYTGRGFLYENSQVQVRDIRELNAFPEGYKPDMVVHFRNRDVGVTAYNYDADTAVEEYLGSTGVDMFLEISRVGVKSAAAMNVSGFLGKSEFLLFDQEEDSQLSNPYAFILRILVETGLPLAQFGENQGHLLVAAPLQSNNFLNVDRYWDDVQTRLNSERRPVVLFNPFGGSLSGKGLKFGDDRIVRSLRALIYGGSFVLFLPNHQTWGSPALAQRIVDSLPHRDKKYVAVVPAIDGEQAVKLKYLIARANKIVTVEGGMMHMVYALGRSVELLLMPKTGPLAHWLPMGWAAQDMTINLYPDQLAGKATDIRQIVELPGDRALTAAPGGIGLTDDDSDAAMTALGEEEIEQLERELPKFNWRKAAEVPWEELVINLGLQPSVDSYYGYPKYRMRFTIDQIIENQKVYLKNSREARGYFLKMLLDLAKGRLDGRDDFKKRLLRLPEIYMTGIDGQTSYITPTSYQSGWSPEKIDEIRRYIKDMHDKLRKAVNALRGRDAIALVRGFYRSAVFGRVFSKGNDGLYMNMVNGLLRLSDRNGIPHQGLDSVISGDFEKEIRRRNTPDASVKPQTDRAMATARGFDAFPGLTGEVGVPTSGARTNPRSERQGGVDLQSIVRTLETTGEGMVPLQFTPEEIEKLDAEIQGLDFRIIGVTPLPVNHLPGFLGLKGYDNDIPISESRPVRLSRREPSLALEKIRK